MAKPDFDSIRQLNEELERLQNSIYSLTNGEKFQLLAQDVADATTRLQSFISAQSGITLTSTTLIGQIEELRKHLTGNDLKELHKRSQRYYQAAINHQKELNKRQVEGLHHLDDFKEKWNEQTKAFRKGINEVVSGGKQMYSSLHKMLDPWLKANEQAMAYAKNMGMSQKTADAYLQKTVKWAAQNNIGLLFNKTTAELIKMQNKYSEILGRNVQLTGKQKKDMLAMEKFLGEDGAFKLADSLENFGLGMSDSADFVKKTFDEATKSGIAASKLTKTIQENIKMAQNYTFKNGLDGLRSMAQKALELKTDLSLVNSFIDKVSTVEGAISTGANLQVLGGNYAMGSDPLSMMYESLNDAEGLFDRAVGMAKGKVFYNHSTGNFEMGAMDRYLMKQAATQMGIDPSKMIDVAFRQASLDKIESQANTNSNISGNADMMRMIKNIATWDRGHAMVNINGKDKRVTDLNAEDLKTLEGMQRTDSQNLYDMAVSLRSTNEILSGIKTEVENEQASIVEKVGQGLTSLLRSQTGILDGIAKIGGILAVISTGVGIVSGGFNVLSGGMRMGKGMRNIAGIGRTVTPASSKAGQMLQGLDPRNSFKSLSGLGKFARVGGSGILAGGLSIGTDLLTGEYQKGPAASLRRGIGAGVGAALGSIGGPIGMMIGGAIGGAVGDAVTEWKKGQYDKIRKDIASKLSATVPQLSGLFTGSDALQGTYNESELKQIAEALKDGRLDSGELSKGLLKQLRANDDLLRIRNSGINVGVAMANGGMLYGRPHSQGGMPILGSNISVEGGEYVVNKEATRDNLALLEKINSGKYKIKGKEALGQQMSVSDRLGGGNALSGLKIGPIDINLSGTIKLESGGKSFDVGQDIINNPVFISKLTDMISKQLNIIENGAYNKGNFRQKFI